ncbi:MAG: acyltransferase [Bacteroidia bacterium]|nr:acyltransferase [Bacteroidia bacterium]
MKSGQNKILYLEGLRGIAAFIVVVHHFICAFYPALYSGNPSESHFQNTATERAIAISPVSILYNGNLAVCIFFVLSGFVLSYKFFVTDSSAALITMGIKRYPRLIIPVAASSLLTYGILKWGYIIPWYKGCFTNSDWLCDLWPTNGNWWHFIKTTFINVPLKGSSDYNTVLWTMEYELKGSVLLILFCFSLILLKKIKWALYLIGIALCFVFKEFYYLAFLAGIGLCYLSAKKTDIGLFEFSTKKVKFFLCLLLIFVFIIFGSFPGVNILPFSGFLFFPINHSLITPEQTAALYHSLAASALLCIVLLSGGLKNFLSKKIFVYLGKISFSMYLLHVLIIGLLTHLMAYLSGMQEGTKYHLAAIAVFIIYLLVVFILSELFYRWVDRPAVKFSNWFGKKAADLVLPKKNSV